LVIIIITTIFFRLFVKLLRQSAVHNDFQELYVRDGNFETKWAYFLGGTLIASAIVYLTIINAEAKSVLNNNNNSND